MTTKRLLFVVVALLFSMFQNARADVPAGFEDPALLAKVMAGKIVNREVANTSLEYRTVLRSFFRHVGPEAYMNLAVDYARYPAMFEEIDEAKTTEINADKTVYSYWAAMSVKVGFFSTKVYPEGRHTLIRAADTKSEAKVQHVITNYQDDLEVAVETTRLIPYQNGILVEDDIHVKLRKSSSYSGMVKKQVVAQFTRIMSTFREVLGGQ